MRDGVNSRAVPGTLLLAVEGAAAGGQSLAQLSEVVTPACGATWELQIGRAHV